MSSIRRSWGESGIGDLAVLAELPQAIPWFRGGENRWGDPPKKLQNNLAV